MSVTSPYSFIKRGNLREKLLKRFWLKVDKHGSQQPHMKTRCWVWTGYKTGGLEHSLKYGYTKVDGKFWRVHRLSHELFKGPIPKGLHVLHSCDNPLCIRPSHLHPGTQKQNREEAIVRGRTAKGKEHGTYTHPERIARGTRSGRAKLNEEIVLKARRDHVAGVSCGDLARRYDVDWKTMSSAVTGTTWVHVVMP